jgi:catechol-2,3-dioxygenase
MSQQPVLDHIAIYVTDLKKSSAFYRDVLGLDSLPEPFRDGKHAWFAIVRANNCISSKEQPAGRTNRKEITPAFALLLCRISLPG